MAGKKIRAGSAIYERPLFQFKPLEREVKKLESGRVKIAKG